MLFLLTISFWTFLVVIHSVLVVLCKIAVKPTSNELYRYYKMNIRRVNFADSFY